MYSFAPDSIKIARYLQKLKVVVREIAPVDSALNKAITIADSLQMAVNLCNFELRALQEDIERYSYHLSGQSLKKEFPYLWEKPVYARPLAAIIHFSFAKENMILQYYFEENLPGILLCFLAMACCYLFLRSLKKQLAAANKLREDFDGQLVVRYPILTAIIFSLSLFQFVFSDPPFIIYFCIWLISSLCLLVVFNRYITVYWQNFWIVIIGMFVLAGLDNMILQTSRTERIFTLLLSATGIAYTAFILSNKHREELKEKNIPWFIRFVLVCQLLSLILNVLGRFNLSKAFLITGYSGVLIAITFLWVVRGINNGLALASSVYTHPSHRLFFINFNRVGKEVPSFLYVLLVAGWIFLVGKNFYALKQLYQAVMVMLTRQRTVGNYSFSIKGMLIFGVILCGAVIISKLVSFFGSEQTGHLQTEKDRKKFTLGSYILLVRIFIISLGLFFAFAAAGLPLDKLTIVLGALGVGIGLGLQGLVTNLVSGLILSFERPVNVGDLIEVNGKTGIMQSIGFRSSVIASADGACIIIPNGELLNQHMVNWTMGKDMKRNSVVIALPLATDLSKAKTVLMEMLNEDERILRFPEPAVYINGTMPGNYQLEIIFWPKHISLSAAVRTDLLVKMDAVFKTQGIVLWK